jgi:hypothetical protein
LKPTVNLFGRDLINLVTQSDALSTFAATFLITMESDLAPGLTSAYARDATSPDA